MKVLIKKNEPFSHFIEDEESLIHEFDVIIKESDRYSFIYTKTRSLRNKMKNLIFMRGDMYDFEKLNSADITKEHGIQVLRVDGLKYDDIIKIFSSKKYEIFHNHELDENRVKTPATLGIFEETDFLINVKKIFFYSMILISIFFLYSRLIIPQKNEVDLSNFSGLVLKSSEINPGMYKSSRYSKSPGIFTVNASFEEALKWGENATLAYGEEGVEIWKLKSVESGVYLNAIKKNINSFFIDNYVKKNNENLMFTYRIDVFQILLFSTLLSVIFVQLRKLFVY